VEIAEGNTLAITYTLPRLNPKQKAQNKIFRLTRISVKELVGNSRKISFDFSFREIESWED
jgi:hypothetical protein